MFALLFAYLLVFRGAWPRPEGATGWITLAYGTVASAQALELLLPPPGMIEWMVVAALAVTSWGAFSGGTRRQLVFTLATLARLLAVLKFSVIPSCRAARIYCSASARSAGASAWPGRSSRA